jgi:hypothetical protein
MSWRTVYVEADLALARGLTIKDVRVSDDDSTVYLDFSGGRTLVLDLDADCCSYSYFEDFVQILSLKGETISFIEERCSQKEDEDSGDDVTKWHLLWVETNRGSYSVDWRNDSNGYYDGSLRTSWRATEVPRG